MNDKRNLAAVLLAVVAAASIGFNFFQASEMRGLRSELAEAKARAVEPGSRPGSPSMFGAAGDSGDASPKPDPAAEAASAGGADGQSNPQGDPFAGMTPEALRQMMSSPTMQEMIRGQQEGMMKNFYDDLLAWLDLPEDQAQEFMNLLVDYQLTGMESAFEAMDPNLTAEDRQKLFDGIKVEKDAAKEDIHSFLGDADRVEYFEAYNKSLPERIQVSDLRKILAETENPLSQQQEQSLLDMIYDARTEFPFDHDFTDQEKIDPTQVTGENLARYNEQYEQLQAQVHSRAGQILSPQQLETFTKSQEQQQAMQQMGLQWMSRLFGQQSGQ